MRARVELGAGLVEQENVGLHGQGAGDAEALLLAEGKDARRVVEAVFDVAPQAGARERPLDQAIDVGGSGDAVDLRAPSDVGADGAWEGRRCAEDHADAPAHFTGVDAGSVKLAATVDDAAADTGPGRQVDESIESPQ